VERARAAAAAFGISSVKVTQLIAQEYENVCAGFMGRYYALAAAG